MLPNCVRKQRQKVNFCQQLPCCQSVPNHCTDTKTYTVQPLNSLWEPRRRKFAHLTIMIISVPPITDSQYHYYFYLQDRGLKAANIWITQCWTQLCKRHVTLYEQNISCCVVTQRKGKRWAISHNWWLTFYLYCNAVLVKFFRSCSTHVTLKDKKRSLSGKNDHNALWH